MREPPTPGGADQPGVRVFLRDVAVDVRCGLHPWERFPERPNRLLVNVEMWAAWPLAAADDVRGRFIDYDRVRDRILSWRRLPHTDLLETLLNGLVDYIFDDPLVTRCRVSISKPDIFAETAGAGVEITCVRPEV